MKKEKIFVRITALVLFVFLLCQLTACVGGNNDLYAGKYVSVSDLDGEMEIKRTKEPEQQVVTFY